jgi:hypothetical protein
MTSGGQRDTRFGEVLPELRLLGANDVDKLAGLVFELASQLHVERQQRMALEELLVRGGLVDRSQLAVLVSDASFGAVVGEELDRSQQRFLDVLIETDDARRPLRPTGPDGGGG